jgi:hypothetical protein
MSPNDVIGWALAAAVPAFLIWAALSFRVWLVGGRIIRPGNYRLAVSCFLLMTTLFIANGIRIRFHVHIGPWRPVFSDWPTVAIDLIWAATVWWGTVVLYGHHLPGAWRWLRGDRTAPPVRDPYLDETEERKERVIRRQNRRVRVVALRYQRLAADLDRIVERIERDDNLLLPKDGQRKDRAWN